MKVYKVFGILAGTIAAGTVTSSIMEQRKYSLKKLREHMPVNTHNVVKKVNCKQVN